jgi:limonene-1,2-epoxide hydrolase
MFSYMEAFRKAIEAKDLDALEAVLADDVRFLSPAVFKAYDGKPAAMVILRAVMAVFEGFRYTKVVESGADSVLIFEARVGDRDIEGADLVHVDEDGRVDSLTVMIRPLSGLNAVVAAMGAQLSQQ